MSQLVITLIYTVYFLPFPAAYKIFKSKDGIIEWRFIIDLYKLQEAIGFRFANKLSKKHVHFFTNKMKVKLAVQVLSSSVADAIDWLREQGAPEFQGSLATTRFIRKLDTIFDFLNSRNPFAKGLKKPIFPNNIEYFQKKTAEWIEYLESLVTLNDISLLLTRRKCFIVGFVTTLRSVLQISIDLLATEYYKYILSYKFSQDHIEFLFCIFRLRLGCNNNPNALQLKYIIKKVLLKNAISLSSAANCTLFHDDNSEIGKLFSIRLPKCRLRKKVEIEDDFSDMPLDLSKIATLDKYSFYRYNILYYIAGYIVFKLIPFVECQDCCSALTSNDEHFYSKGIHSLTVFKNRGGLSLPSGSVFKVVEETERCIQFFVQKENNLNKLRSNIILYNVKKELLFDECRIFPTLDCAGSNFERNHKIELVNQICKRYIKIRAYSLEKELNDRVSQRNQRVKATLFKND